MLRMKTLASLVAGLLIISLAVGQAAGPFRGTLGEKILLKELHPPF